MKIKRQVLINGRPAVEVTDGPGQPSNYFALPTKRPVSVFGRPLVGQWVDKFISPGWRDVVTKNTDETTFITQEDIDAWVIAFDEVYASS